MKASNPVVERIRVALESLPVLAAQRPELDRYANTIGLVGELSRMNNQAMSRKIGSKATQAELYELGKAGYNFARALNRIHSEANTAISAEIGEKRLNDFIYEVFRITKGIYRAHNAVSKSSSRKGTKGALPKSTAAEVTAVVGNVYKAVTGHEPARRTKWDNGKAYGPFHDLLSEVFAAIGIHASADPQADSGHRFPFFQAQCTASNSAASSASKAAATAQRPCRAISEPSVSMLFPASI